jgi:hypothetical protein
VSYNYVAAVLKTALPRPEKLVCVAIASHGDKHGEGCYASYQTLADETSYDERQVIRLVANLEAAGIIVFQHSHPEYGTNVWSIDKKMLTPRPKQAAPARAARSRSRSTQAKATGRSADVGATAAENTDSSDADTMDPEPAAGAAPSHNVTLESDKLGQKGMSNCTSAGQDLSPNLSSENVSLEREKKGPGASAAQTRPLGYAPIFPDAESAPGSARTVDDTPRAREPVDYNARFRRETDLQRKIAQVCGSNHLSLDMKGRLQRTLTLARGKQLPLKYLSPEDEWRAHPRWFNEYVDLCAQRIREHTGRRPGRDMLINWILQYNLPKYGWLDFKERKEIGDAPIRQTQNRHYSKPGTPAWRA